MHRYAVLLQAWLLAKRNYLDCMRICPERTEQFVTENLTMTDAQEIQRRLIELDVEHRDLDAVIEMLTRDGHHDQLQLRRLKKRKLQLKDYITLLKMQLVPDVPA